MQTFVSLIIDLFKLNLQHIVYWPVDEFRDEWSVNDSGNPPSLELKNQ